jgi:hypothetical protein
LERGEGEDKMTCLGVGRIRTRGGRRINYGLLLLLVVTLSAAGCGGDGGAPQAAPTVVHFVPNSHAFWSDPANWTTDYGPAYADILLQPSNFVPCRGGPFALCYYSGPSAGSEDLSCKLTPDGNYANCNCFDIPYGVYYVDINAILNESVYQKTIAQCGADGGACSTPNSALVCQSVNQGTLMPDAKLFSTFSFDCVASNGIGQTGCGAAPYAGCMTAPCSKPNSSGITQCSCPVFDGPYQVGQNNQSCTLGDDLVWSAAYAPPPTPAVVSTPAVMSAQPRTLLPQPGTAPSPGACVPDAPGGYGCGLYVPGTTSLPPNSGVDCQKVCDEYSSCKEKGGIQAGLTCDSTLCTDQCNDLNLVGKACAGLAKCDVSEIIKAETAANCSCCASQLCGCQANSQTDVAIASLVQQQRDVGITPQCDINGTLCGSP